MDQQTLTAVKMESKAQMANQFVCADCARPATQACSSCHQTYYCSREHQKKHWPKHKSHCCPWKIATSEQLGRHLVSVRNIRAGDILLREAPLVVAPKATGAPVCLGCMLPLRPGIDEGEVESYPCDACGWTMCCPKCEDAQIHRLGECALTKPKLQLGPQKEDVSHPAYSAVAVLRCLALRKSRPKDWESLLQLQDHLEEWRNTDLYRALSVNVSGFLRKRLNLVDVDEDLSLRICGIWDTNGFELRRQGAKLRALFLQTSLIAHSCRPNCRRIINPDDGTNPMGVTMTVRAAQNIAKGTVLTTSYTQPLWPTAERRRHLKETKHFDCECERCSDPEELGAHTSTILCTRCSGNMSSQQPLEKKAWKCCKCSHTIPSRQVEWGNDEMRRQLCRAASEAKKSGPLPLEFFLEKYEPAMHPTHSHMSEAKLALVQLYGKAPGYALADLPDDLLDRRESLCRELLTVADVVEPNMSRFRGILLFALQATLAERGKRQDKRRLHKQAQVVMIEATRALEEAATILQDEPDLCDELQKHVLELRDTMDTMD